MEPHLLRRGLRLILLCAFSMALSACNQGDNREVEKSLFRVLTLRELSYGSIIGRGTAFKINGNTAVTNNHVVEDATAVVLIYWRDGKFIQTEARVEYADRARDLAVLKTAYPLPGSALALAMYTPPGGSEAWAFGFPGAADALFGGVRSVADFLEKLPEDASLSFPTRTFGTVSGERQRNRVTFIQHQVPISQGSSGGPLIDACGAVIGINTLTVTGASSISGAVSSRELIELLRWRALDANIARSKCWMIFEPRYIVYSASIISAFLLLAVGLIVFVRYSAQHGSRWTAWRGVQMTRRRPSAASAQVIDITPIPLEVEREALRSPPNAYSASSTPARAPANIPARASAKLIPVGGGRPIEVPLTQVPGGVVIGRGLDCTIVLDDPTISRRHCSLDFDGKGDLRIKDLNSGNGTRINGKQVSSGTVRAGDTVAFGSLEFRLELYSGAAEVAAALPVESNADTWQLAAIDEQGNVTRFVIDGRVSKRTWIVGRINEHADLVIPSPSVSARHAMLRSSADGGLEIQDLGSSNGTSVNGRRIGPKWTAIKASSQLKLGGCEIKVTRGN